MEIRLHHLYTHPNWSWEPTSHVGHARCRCSCLPVSSGSGSTVVPAAVALQHEAHSVGAPSSTICSVSAVGDTAPAAIHSSNSKPTTTVKTLTAIVQLPTRCCMVLLGCQNDPCGNWSLGPEKWAPNSNWDWLILGWGGGNRSASWMGV